MKKIDERVLDIGKADYHTKFVHNDALKTNVKERVLNTPDEKFDLIRNNYISLHINNDIRITLWEAHDGVEISIYQSGCEISNLFYQDLSTNYSRLFLKEKKSDYEMLRNKIKSVRESKLKVTKEVTKYMTADTKSFYAVFDAISGDFE